MGRWLIVAAWVLDRALTGLSRAWSGEQAGQPNRPPDIARILDRGTLIVAMYGRDFPPFIYRDAGGELAGLDVELARDFAGRTGVEAQFSRSAATFDSVVDLVARREADVAVSGLSRTFVRGMRVLYTRPRMLLHHALVINRLALAQQAVSIGDSATVQQLRGPLGVGAGTAHAEWARGRFPHMRVTPFTTWEHALRAAAEGEVAAAYGDELSSARLVRAQPELALKLRTLVLTDTRDPIAIAVAWDRPNLLALLNLYLEDRFPTPLTAEAVLAEGELRVTSEPGRSLVPPAGRK